MLFEQPGEHLLAGVLWRMRVPFFSLALGLFVIWLGAFVMGCGDAARKKVSVQAARSRYAGVVREIDLTGAALSGETRLDGVCANLRVRLPVDACVDLRVRSVLGSVRLPDGDNLVLGERLLCCGTTDEKAPRVSLVVNCVLSQAEIRLG